MLSRLILLALQLVIAWFGAPYIVRYIPGMGRMEIFVYAAVFAVIVWIVGLVLSQVLRDLGQPSSGTLAHSGFAASARSRTFGRAFMRPPRPGPAGGTRTRAPSRPGTSLP